MSLITPHGAASLTPLIATGERLAALETESASLPSITVSSAAAANAVMLGAGYFTPLQGFMNRADALSVATDLKTDNGVFWPVPVLNMVERFDGNVGDRIALRDPNIEGAPVIAVMDVTGIECLSDDDMSLMTREVFGTEDPNHPGVATFNAQGQVLLSGPIEVLNFSYFQSEFPGTFRTAMEIREEIESRGWNRVVAFQTRNPMHRAHEELCRMAMSDLNADGILIHMLLGKLKAGDIPADVRDDSIRTMVDHYFPENTVMVTV